MSKSVKIVLFSILALLFCLSIDKVDVKASNGDYDMPSSTSTIQIPSGSTWNQVMSSHGTPQPGYANTGWYTAIGFIGVDNDICNTTYQYLTPISNDIQVTSTVYDGITYNLKYPVIFINSYPSDLAIPNNYTVYSGTRSVVYPSSGKPILSAFIMGSGQLLAEGAYSDNYTYGVQDPNITYPFSFYSVWFSNYTPSASNPFIWIKPHRNLNEGISRADTIWCSHTDVPVFCDLYKALEYSTTGVIDSSNEDYVLFGSDKAAADMLNPTPTPTDTPTPTPTATPIPYPTSMEISGGNISIDNWPTPEPTMAPWYPYIDPESIYNPEAPFPEILPSGIEQADYEYILKLYRQSSNYLGININDITPTPSSFWSVNNTYLWHSSNGFFPDNVLADFSNPDDDNLYDGVGNVLIYPKTAMENVEDSGFMGFMADSLSCFRRSSENTEHVIEPGDNVMTYFMFAFVGIVVMWFFKNIIK